MRIVSFRSTNGNVFRGAKDEDRPALPIINMHKTLAGIFLLLLAVSLSCGEEIRPATDRPAPKTPAESAACVKLPADLKLELAFESSEKLLVLLSIRDGLEGVWERGTGFCRRARLARVSALAFHGILFGKL